MRWTRPGQTGLLIGYAPGAGKPLPRAGGPLDYIAMDNDKVIRFPGSVPAPAGRKHAKSPAAPTPAPAPASADGSLGPDGLTEDQRKAIQVVLSGMSFVLIGIKPTDRGADFFTSVHGDSGELRNAQSHLDGVIARAFSRKGI